MLRKSFSSILLSILLVGCSGSNSNQPTTATGFVKDNASSDTPVETLKTLTAHITAVEEQNRQLAAQNKTLMEQDKTTLEQFKRDVLSKVNTQLNDAKTTLQQSNLHPVGNSSNTNNATAGNNGANLNSASTSDNTFTSLP